ncbi:MAG TPA: bifunctional hydroxymethylpyrimidine kinase/phosphomethylpyrimidine kinase, partial [Candidatus Binatia bacterium]|nr:bifunctional hydroxymethylpyrimidine kinase/phosphomethylpyrimidine kinase [Candidatus Binatia bacterium]
MESAAKALAKKYHASILLKGGHLRGNNAIDLLFHRGKLTAFSEPFVRGVETHGTGCTYSAAITAGLASGFSLEQAIKRAKKFVTQSIAQHFRWKRGSAAIVALNQSCSRDR